jgi:hypothetical protein
MHDEGNNEEEKKNLHLSTQHMLTKMISSALTLKDQCSHYYTSVAEVHTGMKQSEKIEMRDTTANFG